MVPSAVAPPGTSSDRPLPTLTMDQYPEKGNFQRLSRKPDAHCVCVMSVCRLDVDNQNQNHSN